MKKIISILILLISIFGCDNKKSELEFEKKIMLEIYPNLIDSLWVHNSSLNTLPFVKLDKNGKVIGFEEKSKNDIRKSHNKTLQEIKRKNSKIFAVICDTIYPIGINETNELTEYYKDAIILKNEENDSLKYALNRKKVSQINCVKTKFISKFNMLERPWDTNDKYNFNGVISFSRIQFDTNKKNGILTSEIICGGMCGHGYRIFIKKVKNKWTIDKVEEAWVS